MATSPITATPAVLNPATANLNLNDLLKVLLTELTNQDPLKPTDNTNFMAQIAQFASLETAQQVSQGTQQLVALQSVSQSVGLIGHTVTAIDGTGTVTGKVVALSLSGTTPTMTIQPSDAGLPVVTGVTIGQLQSVLP